VETGLDVTESGNWTSKGTATGRGKCMPKESVNWISRGMKV